MSPQSENQDRVDRFVLIISAVVALILIGMFLDVDFLVLMGAPLIIATFMFMGLLDRRNRWPDRSTMVAALAFHAVSVVLWFIAWLQLGSEEITIGGMPTSSGLIFLIGWPLYTFLSGPLYAFYVTRAEQTKADSFVLQKLA